ncbi:MAG TPA: hypothetical protein VGQ06_00835 [Gemmatimonadales bacterium]|jgi:hypothetical protein|nr:hypothetical protein [Gemmatimonadales bacterium]
MAAWPDLTEYHEAVQHPQKAFADPGLRAVALELDRFGMPKPATGANAVVYKGTKPGGFFSFRKTWAIRCFLRPISDHAERYEAISRHLHKVSLRYDVDFRFLKQGIQIGSNWFPVVKMQWAEGDLLHSYIEKQLRYPWLLAHLRAKWVTLVRDLEAARVAHGDLQHGNILVRDGSIQLVDYDGMWVPALKGRHATETGHRAYQHPERSEHDYGQEIDRFSALVIYLSLAALEEDATLWEKFHTGDNLIFVREDFQQVGRAPIWQQLRRIGSAHIDQLAAAMATVLQQHPMKVGNLDSVLQNLASFKFPTSTPASPPAQRVAPKPAPASKPSVPSWIKGSGYRNSDD